MKKAPLGKKVEAETGRLHFLGGGESDRQGEILKKGVLLIERTSFFGRKYLSKFGKTAQGEQLHMATGGGKPFKVESSVWLPCPSSDRGKRALAN